MQRQYSLRSPAVKRLMKEAQELGEPTEQYYAQPLEDNLFEWHFTVRGPPDSDFEGGVYHGRITLPPEYPMKPPSIMLLTPTGRFEVGTKICLSISGHHPETWQPSWSIRTVLLAIIGFMPTKGEGAIGALDYTPQERKMLAKKSQDWTCKQCTVANKGILPKETSKAKSEETQREAAEIAAQISFKKEDKSKNQAATPEGASSGAAAAPVPEGQAGAVPAGNIPPPNPFAQYNPGAMGMPYAAGQMYPFPPNYMNPGPMGYNPNAAINNQPQQAQTNQSAPATSTTQSTTNSSTPTNQATGSTSPSQSTEGASQPVTPSSPALRQRTGAATTSGANQSGARADPPLIRRGQGRDTAPESSVTVPLVVMMILTLIMIFLLLRRVYNTLEYKFDFDLF